MKIINSINQKDKVTKVRNIIKSAGNKIASVHFIKRSDGSKRKMSFRLRVNTPTYANKPKGDKLTPLKDYNNNQMTVFDVNKVTYNSKGKMNGRGAWRTIPLENVTRVVVNGEIHKIL